MSKCPYLVYEPESTDYTKGYHFCKLKDKRETTDEMHKFCACSYEDKFLTCELYINEEK